MPTVPRRQALDWDNNQAQGQGREVDDGPVGPILRQDGDPVPRVELPGLEQGGGVRDTEFDIVIAQTAPCSVLLEAEGLLRPKRSMASKKISLRVRQSKGASGTTGRDAAAGAIVVIVTCLRRRQPKAPVPRWHIARRQAGMGDGGIGLEHY